ncbi:MAG: DUF853 family protein [Spirochaetales bacterium]|nr:DUF853 family protein [Leptospiraceae bacterium]MCP5483257.1 DUF853 family protein [Spirochaetales bacterium]
MAASNSSLAQMIQDSYPSGDRVITLGAGMVADSANATLPICLPLSTMNRHGLIAGATGTGKTKSLQVIVEELSKRGIPSLVMDIKGDLSGLAAPGESSSGIQSRAKQTGISFEPASCPVELLSLTGKQGLRMRSTVAEFGPLLMARVLGLNDTQEGILSVIFRYCDERSLLLLDTKDLKKVLTFAADEGRAEIEAEYGAIPKASVTTILRKVVALEKEGADELFGEVSFEIQDLMRKDGQGRGVVSILRLDDIQDRPRLFSTFMLQLLAETYEKLPELGDPEQPELVLFIDEAHLIFKEASRALLEQIETVVKLIRSRGVGLFFCTQSPDDVPAAVLAQLGLKVQHALRAFTAKDRKAIKSASENFPVSEHYELAELMTAMGIGEALVTGLDRKGRPTPVVRTMMRAPNSRMGVLKPAEIQAVINASELKEKYDRSVDRESAYEILTARVERAQTEEEPARGRKKQASRAAKEEPSMVESVMESKVAREVGRTVARELTRGLLGVLGISTTTRRRRRSSWF